MSPVTVAPCSDRLSGVAVPREPLFSGSARRDFGMVQEDESFGAQPEGDHVAVLAGNLHVERQHVLPEFPQTSQEPVAFRAGGRFARRHRASSPLMRK